MLGLDARLPGFHVESPLTLYLQIRIAEINCTLGCRGTRSHG